MKNYKLSIENTRELNDTELQNISGGEMTHKVMQDIIGLPLSVWVAFM